MRQRFAPSPSGRLHLGNARSALLGWLQARAAGGEFLLRIEDLDPDRSSAAAVEGIYEDLRWLGLNWDGPVMKQSERSAAYAAALSALDAVGRVYPCWCSRAEIARAASAPHAGEEGPRYPGTCASGGVAKAGRTPCMRFRVAPTETTFVDAVHGLYSQDVDGVVGDFVVRRVDGVASYQLAVVVDDAAQGITDVLRADDLLSSTPRQLQLYQALELKPPTFAHVPLLVDAEGKRLAKRDGSLTLAAQRAAGRNPEEVIGWLAKGSGLSDGSPIKASELVRGFSLAKVSRAALRVTEDAL